MTATDVWIGRQPDRVEKYLALDTTVMQTYQAASAEQLIGKLDRAGIDRARISLAREGDHALAAKAVAEFELALAMPPIERTYFGLEVLSIGQTHVVREADIKALPFYAFWQESRAGSASPRDRDESYVYLHDWKAFAKLFITTGRHRHMPDSS